MLLKLKDQAEIVVAVSASAIAQQKRRGEQKVGVRDAGKDVFAYDIGLLQVAAGHQHRLPGAGQGPDSRGPHRPAGPRHDDRIHATDNLRNNPRSSG